MERINTWNSPKTITVFLVSLMLLVGLMTLANYVRTPVDIPDRNLERVIREKIEKRSGTIYKSDLVTVTELDASGREIQSLEGMEAFSKLVTLNLADNQVEDLTPLGGLKMMRVLDLSNNHITDLATINFDKILYLPLRELKLNNFIKQTPIGINDISLLEHLEELEVIELINNHVENLEPISSLTNLKVLNLYGNNIICLKPLQNLQNLKTLNLGANQLTDLNKVHLGHLSHLPLHELVLENNIINNQEGLSDISILSNFISVNNLALRNNRIQDLEPLSALPDLATLDLRGNKIEHIEPLQNLHNLKHLNLRENFFTDLTPLAKLTNLQYLNIHSNPIESGVEVIRNFEDLEVLIMRNVSIGDSYQFLEKLSNLNRLNIRNTEISDLSVIVELINKGALQDDVAIEILAELNILELIPSLDKNDPYNQLWRYWDNISYRNPRSLSYYQSPIPAPQFSHQSGFYNEEFHLEISSEIPDGKIFYTTNGSEPLLTPDIKPKNYTFEYSKPIRIYNRTKEPNIISNIKTSRDLVHFLPSDDIFKISVIRAIVVNNKGFRSEVVTYTFLVDQDIKDRYSFPIVSISTDPENLFNEEFGIYVAGNMYQPIDRDKPWFNPANYNQRGLNWERPTNIKIFNSVGEIIIDQNAGIRVHGNVSRWLQQKSLRLYARNEYDLNEYFSFNFFPELNNRLNNRTVNTFSTLILRNSGQDWASTFFRDTMAQSLLQDTKLDIQGSYPTIVFLNGEYWGIHNLQTRYDEHYFEAYYGISSNDLTVIHGVTREVLIGEIDSNEHFENIYFMIDSKYLENDYQDSFTFADEIYFEKIKTMVDIDNIIDYYAAQFYVNNTDWPWSNTSIWRMTNPSFSNESANYGHDGKWRWLVFDLDLGFVYPENNTIIRALDDMSRTTYLFRSLLENNTFRVNFINRFADLLNTSFKEDVVIQRIDEYHSLYLPEIEEQTMRWGNLGGTIHDRMNPIRWGSLGGSLNHWNQDVEELREFALSRPNYQRQHIIDYFNLSETVNVTVQTNSTNGLIKINTINICEETAGVNNPESWTGIYFKGIPIEITAFPNFGFEFVGWKILEGEYNVDNISSIMIELNGDITISAIFRAIDS